MKKYFLLWIMTLGVYLFISSKGSLVWKTRQESYFNLQAYSLLQGRLDLVAYPASTFDMSIFAGKVYTYWPPLPAIFVIPFVYISGILASDIFIPPFLVHLVLF